MNRRAACLAVLATFLGRVPLTRGEPAELTIDLSRWSLLRVKYQGHELEIPPQVIWDELTRANG